MKGMIYLTSPSTVKNMDLHYDTEEKTYIHCLLFVRVTFLLIMCVFRFVHQNDSSSQCNFYTLSILVQNIRKWNANFHSKHLDNMSKWKDMRLVA